MDRAIFEFNKKKYYTDKILQLSREDCEHLANIDDEYVTKYNIDTQESLDEVINDYIGYSGLYIYRSFIF